MSAGGAEIRRSVLADLVAELEGGGGGRPEEIARRLGPGWTEDRVLAALAELFSDGLVGHTHEIGLWWVA
jgi:hypothetical protein